MRSKLKEFNVVKAKVGSAAHFRLTKQSGDAANVKHSYKADVVGHKLSQDNQQWTVNKLKRNAI